ncbi:MAG: hypothetical protein WBA36_16695 [Mesorhizobium sp.]
MSDTIVVLGAKVYRRIEALTRLQDIFGDVEKIQPPRSGGPLAAIPTAIIPIDGCRAGVPNCGKA